MKVEQTIEKIMIIKNKLNFLKNQNEYKFVLFYQLIKEIKNINSNLYVIDEIKSAINQHIEYMLDDISDEEVISKSIDEIENILDSYLNDENIIVKKENIDDYYYDSNSTVKRT